MKNASRKQRPEGLPNDMESVIERRLKNCASRSEIADTLRELLDIGAIPAGFRLPSMRRLQEVSGLRQHEVYRALEELAGEGRIEQRRGSGTFVLGDSNGNDGPLTGSLKIGVIPPLWDPGVSHHAIASFLSGITDQAGLKHHIQLLPSRLPVENPMEFPQFIRSSRLDGIIWIKPPVAPPPALVLMLAAGVPVVVVGRSYANLSPATVNYDHHAMADALAEFLILKKRRKLLCMAGVRNDQLMVDEIAAIRTALEKRGLSLPDDQIITVRLESAARVYSADLRCTVLEFLRRHDDFDAVFSCYSDQLDTLTELHDSGYRRCPDDFILIHHGPLNVWGGQQWPPFPVAFVSGPGEELGRQAVKDLEKAAGIESDQKPEDLAPRIEHDPYID